MNRLIIAGIAVVALLYVVFSSLYVVNEREQAIVMRFGQIIDVKEEPGIYFKIPTNVIDSVQVIEDRLLRYDVDNMTLQVSGGKFYEVDAFLTYRIADPRLFRERVQGNLQVAEDRINTRFDAALRQVYGLREFNAALSEERPQMMVEARDLIRPDMALLGIEVVDVRILRTDLTDQVSAETFARMTAERQAEAAFLRARGQEAAQTLKAIADRQAVEIVAASRKDSEILRGEGDATRNRIFADAYSADPEFFEFYRTMESYRTALGANTGTTLVLSPDSEFFRYFGANGDVNLGNLLPGDGQPREPIVLDPLPTDPSLTDPLVTDPLVAPSLLEDAGVIVPDALLTDPATDAATLPTADESTTVTDPSLVSGEAVTPDAGVDAPATVGQ